MYSHKTHTVSKTNASNNFLQWVAQLAVENILKAEDTVSHTKLVIQSLFRHPG